MRIDKSLRKYVIIKKNVGHHYYLLDTLVFINKLAVKLFNTVNKQIPFLFVISKHLGVF